MVQIRFPVTVSGLVEDLQKEPGIKFGQKIKISGGNRFVECCASGVSKSDVTGNLFEDFDRQFCRFVRGKSHHDTTAVFARKTFRRQLPAILDTREREIIHFIGKAVKEFPVHIFDFADQ